MPLVTLRSIARLSRQDLGALAEAVALIIPVEIGLRLMTLDRLLARLSLTHAGRRQDTVSAGRLTPTRAAVLVERLGRLYPLKATCLKKSLVLLRILRRRGFSAELRLGVRQVDGRFSSHAWIDCDGHPLLDEGHANEFTTITIPAQESAT